MEKKEKTAEQKAITKMAQMNKNMFNFIKMIAGVEVQMPTLNQPDPKNPDSFIPEYEIIGKATTNKEFEFKINIDPVDDFQVYFTINNEIKFKLHNNSQLRFVIENYQVAEAKKTVKK